MPRRLSLLALIALVVVGAAALTACGNDPETRLPSGQGIAAADTRGGELFAERCAGCHTLDAADGEGTSENIRDRERVDGPNLNARTERPDQVLYAIRNGGFSGAIMPQNIVTGKEAEQVAAFVAKYAGQSAKGERTPEPGQQETPEGGMTPPENRSDDTGVEKTK